MFKKLFITTEFRNSLPDNELQDILNFSALEKTELFVKKSRYVTCAIDKFPSGRYFFKKIIPRNNIHMLTRLARPSRPFKNLIVQKVLTQNGIMTPKIVAISREIDSNLKLSDYLVSEAFSENSEVNHWLPNYLDNNNLYGMIDELCELLAKLVKVKVEHTDLKLGNIFRTVDNTSKQVFGVFDLDGCKLWPNGVPLLRQNKMLARMISSLRLCSNTYNFKLMDKNKLIDIWIKSYAKFSKLTLNHKSIENLVE